MSEIEHDLALDATGLMCPEPVMLLHNRINEVPVGGTLLVIATDPSTTRDIPRFCHFLGHELLGHSEDDKTFRYYIRRQS